MGEAAGHPCGEAARRGRTAELAGPPGLAPDPGDRQGRAQQQDRRADGGRPPHHGRPDCVAAVGRAEVRDRRGIEGRDRDHANGDARRDVRDVPRFARVKGGDRHGRQHRLARPGGPQGVDEGPRRRLLDRLDGFRPRTPMPRRSNRFHSGRPVMPHAAGPVAVMRYSSSWPTRTDRGLASAASVNPPTPPRNAAVRPSGGNGRTVTRAGRLRPVWSFSRARIDGTSRVPARRGTTRKRLTKTFASPTTGPIPLTLIGPSSLRISQTSAPAIAGGSTSGRWPRATMPTLISKPCPT